MSLLYPLKFNPIYQYRIWGGRRLSNLLTKPLPAHDPIGEAWVLSDRENHESQILEGFLKGKTINELMKQYPEELMGEAANEYDKFPLLLKFLDAQTVLSVQVHPSDDQTEYIPKRESGKRKHGLF